MATLRKPTAPTAAEAIDRFCGDFDDLFARLAERTAVRHYLIGLLLPRERNQTLTGAGRAGPRRRPPAAAPLPPRRALGQRRAQRAAAGTAHGSLASILVGPPAGLSTVIVPPSACARSANPCRPAPCESAPP